MKRIKRLDEYPPAMQAVLLALVAAEKAAQARGRPTPSQERRDGPKQGGV